MMPWAVNTKIKDFCLAHHVDDMWLFDTTRESREVGSGGSRRPNRVSKCTDTQDYEDTYHNITDGLYTRIVYASAPYPSMCPLMLYSLSITQGGYHESFTLERVMFPQVVAWIMPMQQVNGRYNRSRGNGR